MFPHPKHYVAIIIHVITALIIRIAFGVQITRLAPMEMKKTAPIFMNVNFFKLKNV
jgi:hypothetical protein